MGRINLTRIYTRLGDGGETHLGDMSRVPKTHPRLEAYGEIDELNAQIGDVLTRAGLRERARTWLRQIQNDLFDLGADLAVPEAAGDRERLRVRADQVALLEGCCDKVNADLEPLRSFILPGGSAASAYLHLARTVCRRAERIMVALRDQPGEHVDAPALKYVNRLSDFLFVAGRHANGKGTGDVLWAPGQNR